MHWDLKGTMHSSLLLVRSSSSHSSQSSPIHIHTCRGRASSEGGPISIQRSIRPLNDKKAGGWLAGGEICPDRLLVSSRRLPACLPAPPPSSRAAGRAGLEPEAPSSRLPPHLHCCVSAVHSPPTPPIIIISAPPPLHRCLCGPSLPWYSPTPPPFSPPPPSPSAALSPGALWQETEWLRNCCCCCCYCSARDAVKSLLSHVLWVRVLSCVQGSGCESSAVLCVYFLPSKPHSSRSSVLLPGAYLILNIAVCYLRFYLVWTILLIHWMSF